jgi:hypothetical protein
MPSAGKSEVRLGPRVRLEKAHARGCHYRSSNRHPPFVVQPWREDQPKPEYEQRSGPGAGTWLRFLCSDPQCPATALLHQYDLALLIVGRLGWPKRLAR